MSLQNIHRLLTVVLGLWTSMVGTQLTAAEPLVASVDSIGLTVSHLDRSIDFYTRVLSFEQRAEVEALGDDIEHLQGVFGARVRVARLALGDEQIELTEYLAPRGRPIPIDSRSNDRWFQHIAIVTSDMERAYQRLRDHKVQHASTAPQRLPDWNPNAGGIQAFYFHDPDAHVLEIIQFPPGKGDPKWRRADRLFLGIDHTAIVVADTDASLRFYRDTLGLQVAGESENYGTEQEHLNNVFGARLRITALRAASGPGIELLEYLAPRNGRPMPRDVQANDLVHWQTRLIVPSADSVLAALRGRGDTLVSSAIVALSEPMPVPSRALLARDPDGHAMQFVEATGNTRQAGRAGGSR